jgi:hypothetical protein
MEHGCKRMCWSSAMQSKSGSGMAETAILGGEKRFGNGANCVVFSVFVVGIRACSFRDLRRIIAFLPPIL